MDQVINLLVCLYRNTARYSAWDKGVEYTKLFLFARVLEGGPIMEGQEHVLYTPDHHNPHVWAAYKDVLAQAVSCRDYMNEGDFLRIQCVLGVDNVAGRKVTRLFVTHMEMDFGEPDHYDGDQSMFEAEPLKVVAPGDCIMSPDYNPMFDGP